MMKGNFKTYCLQAARYYLLLNRSCCNSVSLFEHILPKLKCLDKWLWTGASKTSPQRSIVMLLLISMDNWLVLLRLCYSLFLMVQMVQRSLQYMMLITVTLEENPTRLAIWILLLPVSQFLNHQIKNFASFVVVVTPRRRQKCSPSGGGAMASAYPGSPHINWSLIIWWFKCGI